MVGQVWGRGVGVQAGVCSFAVQGVLQAVPWRGGRYLKEGTPPTHAVGVCRPAARSRHQAPWCSSARWGQAVFRASGGDVHALMSTNEQVRGVQKHRGISIQQPVNVCQAVCRCGAREGVGAMLVRTASSVRDKRELPQNVEARWPIIASEG